MLNARLSERLAYIGEITPTLINTSVTGVTSSYVSQIASNGNYFRRLLGTVQVAGSVTGTNKVTVSILKASDTNGTGAAAILSASYVGTNANDVIAPMETLDVYYDSTKPYLALHAETTAAGTALVAGILQGGEGKYDSAASYNVSQCATPNCQSS